MWRHFTLCIVRHFVIFMSRIFSLRVCRHTSTSPSDHVPLVSTIKCLRAERKTLRCSGRLIIVIIIVIIIVASLPTSLLHFAWVVDDAKCIVVTRVCVSVCVPACLSLATFPHYCTDPDVTCGNTRGAPSCAPLGRFAIGAPVSLLWQHSANAKCHRVLVLAVCPLF